MMNTDEAVMTRSDVSITVLTKTPSEKRAIKIMAAEEGKSTGEYMRELLYKHTNLKERAAEIEAQMHLDNRKLQR